MHYDNKFEKLKKISLLKRSHTEDNKRYNIK